jgi:hypothetical protein
MFKPPTLFKKKPTLYEKYSTEINNIKINNLNSDNLEDFDESIDQLNTIDGKLRNETTAEHWEGKSALFEWNKNKLTNLISEKKEKLIDIFFRQVKITFIGNVCSLDIYDKKTEYFKFDNSGKRVHLGTYEGYNQNSEIKHWHSEGGKTFDLNFSGGNVYGSESIIEIFIKKKKDLLIRDKRYYELYKLYEPVLKNEIRNSEKPIPRFKTDESGEPIKDSNGKVISFFVPIVPVDIVIPDKILNYQKEQNLPPDELLEKIIKHEKYGEFRYNDKRIILDAEDALSFFPKPEAGQTDTEQTKTGQTKTGQPEAGQTKTEQPDAGQTKTEQPDAGQKGGRKYRNKTKTIRRRRSKKSKKTRHNRKR